uniref:Uncharacterized protein n=1 Tax=Anguilla anguilla TaxID=7936 RepID=A0A0E9SZD7_ANGAN
MSSSKGSGFFKLKIDYIIICNDMEFFTLCVFCDYKLCLVLF